MANGKNVLGKVQGLKQDLQKNERLRKVTERLEKRPYHDARGKFVTRAQEKMNREYAVVLRAHVDSEDFRIFRSALKMVGDEVSGWASGINTTLGMVTEAFSTTASVYTRLGTSGLNKEVKAIDFANRLGLSLPQGRTWSRTFDTMGIKSFDDLIEVYRNPLKRQRLVANLAQEEQTSERRGAPEIQEGIQNFNKLNMELELATKRLQDFGEEWVLANSNKVTNWATKVFSAFNPVVDPRDNKKTFQSLTTAIKNTASKATEDLPQGTGAALLAGGAMTAGFLAKRASVPASIIATAVEGATTGQIPKYAPTGALTLLALRKFPYAIKGLGLLSKYAALYAGGELIGGALGRWQARREYDRQTWENKRRAEGKSLDIFEDLPQVASRGGYSVYKTDFEEQARVLKDGLLKTVLNTKPQRVPEGNSFPIMPGEEEKSALPLASDKERGLSEVLGKLPRDSVTLKDILPDPVLSYNQWRTRSLEKKLREPNPLGIPNDLKEPNPPSTFTAPPITFTVGDIIINVPAGSDGRVIGQQVISTIKSRVKDLGFLDSAEIANRSGRAR